ncbi:acyl-CoA carboxylase epsilon subunit [Streptomyces kaniharaensis]|uniref:acyl-CoA carboxylase epsilon subunit n=1 Tax=Streptomyces kaniharaensis TaxID=212423 RepID=UPI002DDDB40A|nr:acyl-CoA carboxylase epsilon subunit [Streptomyces kaniharaensis]
MDGLRVERGSVADDELAAVTVVLIAALRRRRPAAAGWPAAGRARWRAVGYRAPGAWDE